MGGIRILPGYDLALNSFGMCGLAGVYTANGMISFRLRLRSSFETSCASRRSFKCEDPARWPGTLDFLFYFTGLGITELYLPDLL